MLNQNGLRAIYAFVKEYATEETRWLKKNKWTNDIQRKMKRSVCKKINEKKTEERINGKKTVFYR